MSATRTIEQYHEVASAMAFELNFRPFLELKGTMMIKIKERERLMREKNGLESDYKEKVKMEYDVCV